MVRPFYTFAMTYDHITYEQKQFLLWLGRKPNPHLFEFEDWKEHYSELIDSLYAVFKKWDNQDFKCARRKGEIKPCFSDVYDELTDGATKVINETLDL